MAVGPSDRTGLLGREAEGVGSEERGEDTDLGGSAQQEALRVGDQRAEIGHGAHADEDQTGIDTELDTQVEVVEQSGIGDEDVPVHMTAGEELGMVEVGIRKVREQHAEGDGEQQQRLELVLDGQVEQEEGNQDHGRASPAQVGEETRDSGGTREITQAVPHEIGVGGQ